MRLFWVGVFAANAGFATGDVVRMLFTDYVPGEIQIAQACITAAVFWTWMMVREATRGSNSV